MLSVVWGSLYLSPSVCLEMGLTFPPIVNSGNLIADSPVDIFFSAGAEVTFVSLRASSGEGTAAVGFFSAGATDLAASFTGGWASPVAQTEDAQNRPARVSKTGFCFIAVTCRIQRTTSSRNKLERENNAFWLAQECDKLPHPELAPRSI
jgi:hypothetical protein